MQKELNDLQLIPKIGNSDITFKSKYYFVFDLCAREYFEHKSINKIKKMVSRYCVLTKSNKVIIILLPIYNFDVFMFVFGLYLIGKFKGDEFYFYLTKNLLAIKNKNKLSYLWEIFVIIKNLKSLLKILFL